MSDIADLLAKAVQANTIGQNATYAGGVPNTAQLMGLETLMPTEYGVMLDLDQPHVWIRLHCFFAEDSVFIVGMEEHKQDSGYKHFNRRTELTFSVGNILPEEMPDVFNIMYSPNRETKRAVAPLTAMKKCHGEQKDLCLSAMAHTISYRSKQAAVAWNGEGTKTRMPMPKKLDIPFEQRGKDWVAVLRIGTE